MITGYWSDVHGIFYPDGTVRDPSIPAAVLGFRRKRDEEWYFPMRIRKDMHSAAWPWYRKLCRKKQRFSGREGNPLMRVLEAAEFCANLLEACELVPMYDRLRHAYPVSEKQGDEREARKLAYELALLLQEKCQLL